VNGASRSLTTRLGTGRGISTGGIKIRAPPNGSPLADLPGRRLITLGDGTISASIWNGALSRWSPEGYIDCMATKPTQESATRNRISNAHRCLWRRSILVPDRSTPIARVGTKQHKAIPRPDARRAGPCLDNPIFGEAGRSQ